MEQQRQVLWKMNNVVHEPNGTLDYGVRKSDGDGTVRPLPGHDVCVSPCCVWILALPGGLAAMCGWQHCSLVGCSFWMTERVLDSWRCGLWRCMVLLWRLVACVDLQKLASRQAGLLSVCGYSSNLTAWTGSMCNQGQFRILGW